MVAECSVIYFPIIGAADAIISFLRYLSQINCSVIKFIIIINRVMECANRFTVLEPNEILAFLTRKPLE